MGNNNGYNLNFIDWENEWEAAEEAMEGNPHEMMIEGILNGQIEELHNEFHESDEEC
jgi:hypothetical protein